jgi:hypothetical protein
VTKDKYIDLIGQTDVRVRVERVDGNWSRHGVEVWWDRELIAFMAPAGPSVKTINEAEAKVLTAIRAVDIDPGNARGEVAMFHGTFVKVDVWCPVGTAKRLGIKGYGK